MSKLSAISKFIDSLNRKICALAGWLCLILVILTVEQVIARYLFNSPSNALEELKWHIFGAIFLLAGANNLHEDGHVRVDIFYQNFSNRKKTLVNTMGIILFLIPTAVFIVYYGIDFAYSAYSLPNVRVDNFYSLAISDGDTTTFLYSLCSRIELFLRSYVLRGEVSSSQGGLDARWLIKAFIPLGFFLYVLQAISMLIKTALGFMQVESEKK